MGNSFQPPIATGRQTAGLPSGRLGTWWLVASEIVIFGGLIASFVMYRLRHGEYWALQAEHTKLYAGALNTFILLTSSYLVVCAHQAAHKGEGRKAAKFLYQTIILGGCFLCVKAYEYNAEISAGFGPLSDLFWTFYYTATGIHGIHVVIGMITMGVIAKDASNGRQLQRVECIGIYWHFVDVVWIFLFPLFYIASGI